MSKKLESTVKIARFKAGLSGYLRAVRKGHPLVLMDRDTPIAWVLPYLGNKERLTIRKPLGRAVPSRLPAPLSKGVDSLAALMEERQGNR